MRRCVCRFVEVRRVFDNCCNPMRIREHVHELFSKDASTDTREILISESCCWGPPRYGSRVGFSFGLTSNSSEWAMCQIMVFNLGFGGVATVTLGPHNAS